MNTTHIGGSAEQVVALWLQSQGYAIIDQNWKTKRCEIDIVAKKQSIMYFVEVRHRTSDTWGDGLATISYKKQQQVRFAANIWMHNMSWTGDARILFVATTGSPPAITAVIEQ